LILFRFKDWAIRTDPLIYISFSWTHLIVKPLKVFRVTVELSIILWLGPIKVRLITVSPHKISKLLLNIWSLLLWEFVQKWLAAHRKIFCILFIINYLRVLLFKYWIIAIVCVWCSLEYEGIKNHHRSHLGKTGTFNELGFYRLNFSRFFQYVFLMF